MDNSSDKACSSHGCGGSPSDGGGGTDEVGEGQDEEPSSSSSTHVQVESELDSFRLKWKREIDTSPLAEKKHLKPLQDESLDTIEKKAEWLFLRGVQAERLGKLQDAISLYRRAIQLVPDIEFRVDENLSDNADFDETEVASDTAEDSESEDEIDDLIEKFEKLKAQTANICMPKLDQKISHISSLPPEIFIYILKWVISQDLDVVSLEQIAMVCRGFYLCARDNELWKLICFRTWGASNETSNRYGSWRDMFLQKPRVCFNGVYISKTNYVRYGESSFQDTSYRPCYLVEYYRYLRFFPDGSVLMLTTPDDPYQCVYHLRSAKHPNVMSGRYKIVGNVVMAVVKKAKSENSSNYYNSNRVRQRQRQANMQETNDVTFHLELELKNYKKRINCQLTWKRYSIHTVYLNGQESVSNFDLVPSNFPSFWFSRVKSFTSESESPLK